MRRRKPKPFRPEAGRKHPRKRPPQRSSTNTRTRRLATPRTAEEFFNRPTTYRDKKSGRFVSESTWKRSKAHGGTRYVRQRTKTRSQNLRNLNVLGFDGYVPVVVHSSKQAKLDSRHLIAVSQFLRTGNTDLLKPFIGKRVGGVELLTDPNRLREFADAGLVKLDALYRQNRGGRQEK